MSGLSPLNTFATADDRATAYAAWATRLKARTEPDEPGDDQPVVHADGHEPMDWSPEALFAQHD